MRVHLPATLRRAALALLIFATALLVTAGIPVAAGAVSPVLCTVIVTAGAEGDFECLLLDSGSAFTTIPTGRYLHVTDILINRNSLASSGSYYATIGRDSGSFPAEPRVTTSGTPLKLTEMHFETPVIVLGEREVLSARNDGSSDFGLNVYAAGFVADTVLVPEPGEDLMVGVGAGTLAWLAAHRRRAGRHGKQNGRPGPSATRPT